jgi:hypothetical protein
LLFEDSKIVRVFESDEQRYKVDVVDIKTSKEILYRSLYHRSGIRAKRRMGTEFGRVRPDDEAN